jgi:hypothetical protein
MSAGRREHDPTWTAAADQADAAVADVSARLRTSYLIRAAQESAATGHPAELVAEAKGKPYGPLAELLARVAARLRAGELSGCPHVAVALAPGLVRGAHVEALFWLSWHPGTVSCPACMVLLPPATGDEDRRCDGCRRVVPPGTQIQVGSDVTRADPGAAQGGRVAPPLVCCFGLCPACFKASGYAESPRA